MTWNLKVWSVTLTLMRLLLLSTDVGEATADDIFHISQIETLPMTHAIIKRETKRDKILSDVYQKVQNGWQPVGKERLYTPFYSSRNALTIHQGCLLWETKVIIHSKLRTQVLDQLHSSYPGVVRMKWLARSYVWWPGIDSDIEEPVKQYDSCQQQQNAPAKAFLHQWDWPSAPPRERVHIDYLRPFMNRMFFVMFDAHSKWPEYFMLKSTTTSRTTKNLEISFRWKWHLFTNRSWQWKSVRVERNDFILHLRSAADQASTNGQAERMVQTFKNSMRAMKS